MKRTLFVLTIAFTFVASACQQGQEPAMDTETTTTTTSENTIGMLQHTVYFYLNEDVTEEEKQQFEEGLEALLAIDTVYKSEIGIPSDTPERDVTDHSFGYSIFTWFETIEDYNVYAEHPDHLEFIDTYSSLWADVKVYDSEIIQPMN